MSNPSLSTVILLPLRTSGFMHTPSCECCAITHQCGITRHWHWRHALQVQRNKNAYCHCCDWLKELPYYSCQSFSYDIKKWRGTKTQSSKVQQFIKWTLFSLEISLLFFLISNIWKIIYMHFIAPPPGWLFQIITFIVNVKQLSLLLLFPVMHIRNNSKTYRIMISIQ